MSTEKSAKVHIELERLAAKLGLPIGVRETSERLAATLVARKLADRVPPPVIAASSTYLASRESQTAITLKQLAEVTGSSPKEIGRFYRQIVTEMNLKPQPVDSALHAMRVAERAKVSEKAANLASVMVKKAVEKGYAGRNPVTLAAAAVYVASLMMGESMTQSAAAEAAGIAELSVRECAREIRSLLGIH